MLLTLSCAHGAFQHLRLLDNLLAHWKLHVFGRRRHCYKRVSQVGCRWTLALLQGLLFDVYRRHIAILLRHLHVAESYKLLSELVHVVNEQL